VDEAGAPVEDNPEESKVMAKLHEWWNIFVAWLKKLFKKKDNKSE
jgi:hypothetical protein